MFKTDKFEDKQSRVESSNIRVKKNGILALLEFEYEFTYNPKSKFPIAKKKLNGHNTTLK